MFLMHFKATMIKSRRAHLKGEVCQSVPFIIRAFN